MAHPFGRRESRGYPAGDEGLSQGDDLRPRGGLSRRTLGGPELLASATDRLSVGAFGVADPFICGCAFGYVARQQVLRERDQAPQRYGPVVRVFHAHVDVRRVAGGA